MAAGPAPGSLPRTLGPRLSSLLRAYYLGPDHPMKIRLWWWFRRALGYPRLTIPYGNGGVITVDERDLLQGRMFVTGSYEDEVWQAASGLIDPGDVVWDIGAHIGGFALRALRDTRVREVHAFEPDPLTADLLAYHFQINRGPAQLHRLALGDTVASATLTHGPLANTGLSTLEVVKETPGRPTFAVPCRPADDVIASGLAPRPDVVKIDVEGWEGRVLGGAARLLSSSPPKAIVFEAECTPSGALTDPEIVRLLARLDYTVRRIRRPDGIVDTRENYLAVHASVCATAPPAATPTPAAIGTA